MNALLLLLILLIVATLAIVGREGLRNLLGLAINFGLFFLIIVLLNWRLNALLVLAVTTIFMLAIAIFLSSNNEKVTGIAFKSSLIVVLSLTLLAVLVQQLGLLQGFSDVNIDELEGLSVNIGLNFSNVTIVVMVISMLGAVAEAAMAVTADLSELIEQDETGHGLTLNELQTHREIVSRQILGTSINTLFFGMLGASTALVLLYTRMHESLASILNSKLLVADIASMLLGMIGLLLVIELSGYFVLKGFEKTLEAIDNNLK